MSQDEAQQYEAAVEAAQEEFLRTWQEGPTVTTWDETPAQTGDSAPSFALPDQSGAMVSLESLIDDGSVLLLFWRHFGCGCGFERAGRLRDELENYRAAGADVVIIAQGVPAQAAAYAEQEGLELPILTDPDRSVYRAFGLLDALQPQVLFDAPQWMWSYSAETAERFVAARRDPGRRLVNSPWLLPGEFVVNRDGVIIHAYRYQYCEDFPDPRVHLTAISGSALEDAD